MKILLSLIITLASFNGITQTSINCRVKGTLTIKSTGEPLVFAKLYFSKDSVMVSAAQSDFEGKYLIHNLPAGLYSVKINSPEIKEKTINGVRIEKDSSEFVVLDFKLEGSLIDIQEVKISAEKRISVSRVTVSREDIARLPARTANGVASTVGGINIRGARKSRSIEPSRENYNRIVENEFNTAKRTPLSTFSIDVDKASYSNVRRFISDNQKPPIDAVRIEEMINYFQYDYPKPDENHPFSVTTAYSDCPWNKEHKLAFIGLQGKEIETSQALPNNLVFLIDVSGSMQSRDKLDLMKSGLYLLIDQLRQEDQVSIVVYAGAAGVVLPVTKGNMKDKIKDAIQKLTAGGSTAGGAGIELAYKLAKDNFLEKGNNRVILATDGDFNVGISNQSELIKLIESKRVENIYLSVLGFGTGNLQDGTMEQLADKGNGNYNYIDNIKEAKKVLVDEMGGTLITIANDVKLQVEFNPKNVKGYRLVGYENRSLNDEDFNNDKVDAGDMGAGHAVTAIYEIIPANSGETLANIDDLKYQKKAKNERKKAYSNELLTVKIRYKKPNELKSILFSEMVSSTSCSYVELPEYFQFAGTVAAFGKLLRDSKFKGDLNIESILEMANASIAADKANYRKEFIRLVELSRNLSL